MKTKILPPIREKTEYFEGVERIIRQIFREQIYIPILIEIRAPRKVLENSVDDLKRVVERGYVTFSKGKFRGRFTAATSSYLESLGAKWDRSESAWVIPNNRLPVGIRQAISLSENRFKETLKRIDARLAKMNPAEFTDQLKLIKAFDTTLFKVDKSVAKTLEGITIQVKLTPEERAKIAERYTANLDLYIKKWSDEEILKLRKTVSKTSFSGARYDKLTNIIQDSYGQSREKAKFLARQETSLMITNFKQVRYEAAGSTSYLWTCVVGSPNHPVRPFHKKLNDSLQKWDSPPIVDSKGNRKHPGQDYNCRCTARPIIKL